VRILACSILANLLINKEKNHQRRKRITKDAMVEIK